MNLNIRKPNLENLNLKGIPKDFIDVMNYFNSALKDNALPWIPRKTPITQEEIRDKWIPSLSKNICYVADLEGKVVGCATVFYDTKSTAYEHASRRVKGELVLTVDPKENYAIISGELDKAIAKELKLTDRKAIGYISSSSPAVKGMQLAGYKPVRTLTKPEFNEEVLEYNLP